MDNLFINLKAPNPLNFSIALDVVINCNNHFSFHAHRTLTVYNNPMAERFLSILIWTRFINLEFQVQVKYEN